MSITYPLTIPSSISPKRVRLFSINAVAVARSPFDFTTQVQEFSGQSWSAEVSYPDMTREQAEEFNSFLLSLMGQVGTFYLGDPLGKSPRGVATGTPKVNGASQTGNQIITDGWSNSITGILLAGDYLQLGQRLYKVLQDVDSNGSGQATIDIFPRLVESPADNETVITENCVGIFRLASNINSIFDSNEERLYNISFSCIEAR